MAAHLRSRIRAAIVGLLGGLPTTGGRVFDYPVHPTDDLPCLLVFGGQEVISADGMTSPRTMERRMQLIVRAVAKNNTALQDELDQILKEVEGALAMPCHALAPYAPSITLAGLTPELVGTAERPTGQMAMTFEVVYYAAEGAPDISVSPST